MEQPLISESIMAYDLSFSEKKLLAYICQQAIANNGQCTDSNNDLATALGIHTQTISRLINQLSERKLLQTHIAKDRANQRTLTPLDTLLVDYKPNVYSTNKAYKHWVSNAPSDYKHSASNSSADYKHSVCSPSDYKHSGSDPFSDYKHSDSNPSSIEDQPVLDQTRRCLITGLDISQQAESETFVNRQTLQLLKQTQPTTFEKLATQLLTPEEWTRLAKDADSCSLRMASRVRRLAKREVELAVYALKPVRVCPISGADITHQGVHYPFVTLETIMMLFKVERAAFTDIVVKLGLPDESGKDRDTQCGRVLDRVLQLARTWVPQYPITYLEASGQASTDQAGVHRYCPLTRIDITHQPEKHRFATALTVEALFKSNRSGFDEVAARLLPETYRQDEPAGQCLALSSRVKKLAQAYQ